MFSSTDADPHADPHATDYADLYGRQRTLLLELAEADPKSAAADRHLAMMDDARLAFWADDAARARVDAAAASGNPAESLDGRTARAALAWWQAAGDADAQAKAVDAVDALVAAAPGNAPGSASVADGIRTMLQSTPATVALGQRLTVDLTVKTRTSVGRAYAAQPNKVDEPIDVVGPQLDGKVFRSSALAGHVVLVEFWATASETSVAELPHVAQLLQQYHGQGLDVVGVSGDGDRKPLAAFPKAHPEVTWPQLFTPGGSPLVKRFGLGALPVVYLIDRHGLLRTTDGGPLMDRMVPALLAEAYTPPPGRPTAAAANASSARPTPPGGVPADAVHDALRRAAGATMH